MTFLTGKSIIDDALSLIRNNSTPVRVKMLVWLNIQAQKLAVVRPWLFLANGSATLTPADNVLTMPADYGQFQSLRAGTAFFMDCTKLLTPGEAWQLDKSSTGLSTPRGYTEGIVEVTDPGPPVVVSKRAIITLHGAGFTGNVTVNYAIEPPAIADTTADTSWPTKCRPLFMRSLLDFFYEYDMDERAGMSYQLSSAELDELKRWDNSMKPRSQPNRHGYMRSR